MAPDPAKPRLRASDADREAAAERLRIAAGEGRLDAVELEERLASAYAARYCDELPPLVSDVTPPPAPVRPPGPPVFVRSTRPTNGLAVASLITGVLWMWWFGAVLAVVFGHLALRQIAASGGTQAGRGLAVAGLALGYIELSALLVTLLTVATV
jgi:hypothetical protein